jgi:twitching motility protein PilT
MARLEQLFSALRDKQGSDLHLAAGKCPAFRDSGQVVALDERSGPISDADLRSLLKELVTERQWQAFEREHDLDFAYALPGVGRFRGNYFEQHHGVAAVFRRIPEEIVPAEALGLPPSVPKLADLDAGLVLVTGPTGSGKSTTLASLIDLINRRHRKHIVTIEDPLEFVHRNRKSVVSHREVGSHAPSFSEALAAALRQDANVVLVGEMRDFETIALAMEGASMGVLVLGTLHTNGAAKTIDRIVDVFPRDQKAQARGMLAESLQAVVSQILCRKIGGGRVGIHEVLLRESGLAGAIREANPGMLNSIIGAGKGRGMQLLDDALETAVKNGVIDGAEAYRKANSKQRFQAFAGAAHD